VNEDYQHYMDKIAKLIKAIRYRYQDNGIGVQLTHSFNERPHLCGAQGTVQTWDSLFSCGVGLKLATIVEVTDTGTLIKQRSKTISLFTLSNSYVSSEAIISVV
jgi:hypothetical protein